MEAQSPTTTSVTPDSVEPDSVKVTKTVAMEDEDLYSLSTYDVPGKHLNPFKK
jgi:hypothetical protein